MTKIESRQQQPKHFVTRWCWLQFSLVFIYLHLLNYPLSSLPSSPMLLCVYKYRKCTHTHTHTERQREGGRGRERERERERVCVGVGVRT